MSSVLLEGLTPEQVAAVTHGVGPLLVVAGAGTGKTKVLTTRIAQLVSQGVKPENIVALTFTDKAAEEMSERVDELLPLGTNLVTITTFHSFTTDILRTYAHLLGLPADFSLLTKEEELVLLREHIFNLPLTKLRPGSNPTKFLFSLQTFFNRLKDEAISPSELAAVAKKYLAKSDQADQDAGVTWQELAATYEAYEAILRERGYLTFGHCITETIKLLTEHADVLRQLRRQYHYLLVDEYQDTNWAQTELAALLAGKQGNLMVVGDDDQAIYGFRGAGTTNLIDFKKRYPTGVQIILTQNFRSTQNILDTAYRMIQHNNPDRLEFQHKINKRLVSPTTGPEPTWQLFDRLSSELAGIARQVQHWLDADILPQEIAILARTRSHAAVIAQTLRHHGLPVNHDQGVALTEQPLIKGVLAWLALLKNPQDNIAFFNVLANPPISLPAAALNRLISSRPYREDVYFDYVADLLTQPPTWLEPADLKKVTRVFTWHTELSDTVGLRPSVALLRLIHTTKLYQKLTRSSTPENESDLAKLGELFELLQNYEERHRSATTAEWLNYLDVVSDTGLESSIELADRDPFAVNVMTVHQSKGLEFTAVIVAHCVTGRFPSRRQSEPFSIPQELIKESLPEGDVHLEEERRLFYVAVTRAKRQLMITAAERYGEAKRHTKVAPFVLESFGDTIIKEPTTVSVSPADYLQAVLDLPETTTAPGRPTSPQRLTISHTDLSTYLDCPQRYRYKAILKIRVYPGAALIFGIALHNTLRAYFDTKRRGQSIPLADLLERYWISGGYESRTQEAQRKAEGLAALTALEAELTVTQPERLEWSFNIPLPSGDRLKGRIDRLDETADQKLAIVDYKTGAPKPLAAAKKDLQLGMYILAVEKTLRRPVATVTLHYLLPDVKVTVNRAEFALDTITKSIDQALTDLKHDLATDSFVAKPDKFKCGYCDYKKLCPFRYTE